MSKKRKHKHTHKRIQHAGEGHPVTVSTALLVLPEQAVNSAKPLSNWSLLTVLVIGVILGAFSAFVVLHKPSTEVMLKQLLAEDVTEPDAAEVGLSPEGVNIATGTISNKLEFILATSSVASATSSPLSVKIPTVIYHSVRSHVAGESKYQDLYDVTPELLDQELSYIEENGYHPILMRDVDAYWRGATSTFPAKPIILSFDDGWKNQFEYAYPLLTKHHMKAVFYIFTNPLDHKKSHWMSWEDIRALDAAGMEIGGHTRTHPILTKIAHDNNKLDYEISEPKRIIEQQLGHPIISFAYPFGAKNEAVEVAVARAGYMTARTTISGVWNDPLHRLEFHGTLSSDKLSQFKWLLSTQ